MLTVTRPGSGPAGANTVSGPSAVFTVARPLPDLGQLAGNEVGRADECGDEWRSRLVIQLRRRADLHDLAILHHRDPVGDAERLLSDRA